MAENIIHMKWKRPESLEYPKVWHRFMARDVDSDQMVEYRIEDLVESRAEEAYKHMRDFYFVDEPISQALGKRIKLPNKTDHNSVLLFKRWCQR